MITVIYENNDIVVELKGLKNATTGAWINDATVTMSVYKSNGSLEANGTWPLAMPYVIRTRGIYRAILGGYLDLVEDERVDIVISANGSGIQSEYTCSNVKVKKRC